MELLGDYLAAERIGYSESGKTMIWQITNRESNVHLGHVRRNGGWRCYCFFPLFQTFYEQKCLRAIADFCQEKTQTQRETWQQMRKQ